MKPIDYSARYDERAIKLARRRAQREEVCDIIASTALFLFIAAATWLGFAL